MTKDQISLPKSVHLEPSKLNDASSGTAGLIASEIAAEEELLLLPQPVYSATNEDDVSEIEQEDKFAGYALKGSKLYLFLLTSYFAAFLSALDGTVVSTLMGVIASDLHQIPNMSWIATSYLLAAAACQPLYGKISDIYGRRPVLLCCAILFSIGCAITSLKSFHCVIIGRFITGIGGSGFNTVTTISTSDVVPLRDRGLYQGFGNIAYSVGAASGGILGGFINDLFGWQFVFAIQVPLAAAIGTIFYLFFKLPAGSPGLGSSGNAAEKLKRIDFIGSFFLVLSLIMFLLVASLGGQMFPYRSTECYLMVAGALVCLFAFVYTELKVAPEPILPVTLFCDRTILSAALTNWFVTMACFTYIFYYPLYLTAVIQLPSSKVGLRVIANFVGVSFGSVGAGLYMKKTGRYYNLNVVALLATWVGVFNFLLLTPKTSTWKQMLAMVLPGWGYAVMLTVSLLALIAAVPVEFQSATTSIQYTSRFTGSTLGVSVASAIFQSLLGKNLRSQIPSVIADPKTAAKIIKQALKDAEFAKTAPETIRNAIISCYDVAIKGAFGFAFATATLGLIASLFLREHKLHTSINRD